MSRKFPFSIDIMNPEPLLLKMKRPVAALMNRCPPEVIDEPTNSSPLCVAVPLASNACVVVNSGLSDALAFWM